MSAGVCVNSHWQALTSLNEKEMRWRGKTWPCIFHELCTSVQELCQVFFFSMFWSSCSLGHIYTVLLSLCVMHLCLCLWQTSLRQSSWNAVAIWRAGTSCWATSCLTCCLWGQTTSTFSAWWKCGTGLWMWGSPFTARHSSGPRESMDTLQLINKK